MPKCNYGNGRRRVGRVMCLALGRWCGGEGGGALLTSVPTAGRYYTDRCDVFSFGMMVWEMLARRRPMLLGTSRTNNMAILYAMANGE